ncbi:hypothetical protein FIA58_019285 [Flavobacterium jejuense]|uniref:ABC-2 type transporter domain-containing protein n=1 Tax=Flavobacterium jejuense TaxID=1544455 RepID=A0ABX0IVI5_9FLAO|nr:hypothetical protein [Flavobacterium jejuense]NHN27827.1 hypothetical protein [Flavobacterium jejuense]
MLKDIQKQLLLKYPLPWNTKFVPMLIIGVLFHLIFFGLGYFDGTIDFSNKINYDISTFSMLFGVLLCIIVIILWLVNYFKNNSLKSFYSKSRASLFYEWAQIFVICLLLITFYLPFQFGKQFHQKNYFSLEETKRRCEIISAADFFIDGSFAQTEIDSLASGLIDSIGNKIVKSNEYEYERSENEVFNDYMIFNGKKYNQYSLLNRNNFHFTVNSTKEDSILKLKVQNWLYTNSQQEVKNLMNTYLTIIKEHHLKTNLTPEKWFESTYKNPDFDNFLYIKPYLIEYEADSWYNYSDRRFQPYQDYDTGKYSKYYVQQNVLKVKYDTVSDAHTNSYFEYEMLLSFLYGALGLSLLIFSFRVTTGKSWLIAIVTTGILNIFYGIFSAFSGSGMLYAYLILFTIVGIIIYFFWVYSIKKNIQLTRVILNMILWSFSTFIPIVYFLLIEAYRYQDYLYDSEIQKYYENPFYIWLKDHALEMFSVNFIVSVIALFFLSIIIRNWKGLAEE